MRTIQYAYTILQKRRNFKLTAVRIRIFVKNADFYVNTVMSTALNFSEFVFTIFDYIARYRWYSPCSFTIS